jgi:hypothetical protein
MSTPTYMDNLRRMAQALTALTRPRHHEFNEEEEADGPDPHDAEVESDMEREARDGNV